ncbi:PREDICTED: uncharacterized protein LOC105555705 [Vollenhovia emeryi]|uniref:uncharacterized protein LOC105555705 n=1 Tax=Vollenhovia emeryi TaxID=411798 RepID=UPI0005F565E0|nr:PREDICTED: uncharacterized protein LOC105555705 [Vollenhovia emeryi]
MEVTFPGGREVIGEAFKTRLVPAIAIPTMLASLSESTIKQYSRPLRLWWNHCQRHRLPLYSPTVSQTLEFLVQEIHESNSTLSYSTLNTMRSAISLISQNEIGQHPTIRHFCKGFATLKPPRPRYDYVWDPAPVIAKLSSIYPYDSFTLIVITKKLVLLLALATGQRAQTLASLRLSQISVREKMIMRIPDWIKTSAPGRAQPFFCFSRFTDHENLCIVRLVEHYLTITRVGK